MGFRLIKALSHHFMQIKSLGASDLLHQLIEAIFSVFVQSD